MNIFSARFEQYNGHIFFKLYIVLPRQELSYQWARLKLLA